MLTTFKRAAYEFFKAHAGGIVGRAAIGAANLARAEKIGSDLGWYVDWSYDPDGDLGDHDYWCKPDRAEYDPGVWRTVSCNHQIEQALLRDADDNILGSLGGIIDADRHYRRVVEAELMADAVAEGAHEPSPTPEVPTCPTCGQTVPAAA